jgi:hypothetical protein
MYADFVVQTGDGEFVDVSGGPEDFEYVMKKRQAFFKQLAEWDGE